MNRVNFKNINTKSVDQSYFKPKVNVKVKKEVEEKPKYQSGNRKYEEAHILYDWKFFREHPGKGIVEQIQDKKEYPKITIREEMKPNSEMTLNDLEEIVGEVFKPRSKITDQIQDNNHPGIIGKIHQEKYPVDPGKLSHLDNIVDRNVIESKVEKPKDEITKELINNDKRSYQDRGYYGWHGHFKYKLESCFIKITDNVGGCGVQQLYDWGSNLNNPNIPKLLDYVLKDLNNGVGIILCQVGSNYYNSLFCKTLEKLGFKYHEEYKNHQHGGRDTGRIYTLIIDKNEENKRVTTEK